MNITIGGYYGFGNLGDEETLRLLIRDIKGEYPNAGITVFSAMSYSNAKSVSRNSLSEIKKALSESDIFILGGGSLIQDATSVRSLFYYCELIRLAHKMGCKVMILGGGIGPLKHKSYAADALRLCSYISVRDEYSKMLLNELGIPCVLTTDRLLSLNSISYSGKGRYFTVNLRRCKESRQINVDALADGLYPFINDGYTPIYVSMQDNYDRSILSSAACITGGRIVTPRSMEELVSLQRGARFSIGMRLHFIVSAALAECPAVSLSYDPKCSLLHLSALDAFRFAPHELTNAINSARSATLPQNRFKLCRKDILEIGNNFTENAENRYRCLK